MPGHYFPKTAKTKPCYSLIDAMNRPIVFVGGVTVSSTKDRPNPPDPICGMKLGYTSLGNGHIMALQLGGPDDSYNIVPQYQQWQQSGEWRVLEKDAMDHAANGDWIFVAQLHYGNAGNIKSNKADERFSAGEVTIYWDDERIPTIFSIWMIAASSAEGKSIQAMILDPAAKTQAASALALPGLLSKVTKFRENVDQNGSMPEEDRRYWRSQELGNTVSAAFGQYREFREEQMVEAEQEMSSGKIGKSSERGEMLDVMRSPMRQTEYEFIDGYGDEIRQIVQADRGWLPHEMSQYGSNTQMLQAVFHESKLKAGTKRNNVKRLKDYKVLFDAGVKKRKRHANSTPAYGKMLDRFQRGLNK